MAKQRCVASVCSFLFYLVLFWSMLLGLVCLRCVALRGFVLLCLRYVVLFWVVCFTLL